MDGVNELTRVELRKNSSQKDPKLYTTKVCSNKLIFYTCSRIMITCPLFHLIFIFSNPIIVIVTRVYSPYVLLSCMSIQQHDYKPNKIFSPSSNNSFHKLEGCCFYFIVKYYLLCFWLYFCP